MQILIHNLINKIKYKLHIYKPNQKWWNFCMHATTHFLTLRKDVDKNLYSQTELSFKTSRDLILCKSTYKFIQFTFSKCLVLSPFLEFIQSKCDNNETT